MKNSLLKFGGALLLALAAASFAKADPIVGRIDVNQFGSVASIDFTTKTVTFSNDHNSLVSFTSGDYAGMLGTSANYLSFSYAASSPSQMVWQIDANTYFVLNTFTKISPIDGVGLSLWGVGTIFVAGHDATSGNWTFTATQADGSPDFNFSSGVVSPAVPKVPDGGTTALLVGLGLVGMSVIARRRK